MKRLDPEYNPREDSVDMNESTTGQYVAHVELCNLAAEFEKKMQAIRDNPTYQRDPERAHSAADALLLDTLCKLGFDRGCEIYGNIKMY